MKPERTRHRGRPAKPREEARKACWRFLLERGPDFRGTRRRLDSILRDFRAFAAPLELHGMTLQSFRALLRHTRRHFLKRDTHLAAYEAAKERATRDRAKKRAAIEAKRKR